MPAGGFRFLGQSAWNWETRGFLRACVGHVLLGHQPFEANHRPPADHRVPADFCGICVASAADADSDDYVIARLRELGITQVRVDYTYGSESNHVDRFLNALLDADFAVLLHLVQPKDAAEQMPGDAAQARWRSFVADVLGRYGPRLDAVEFGSTVNRRRWAGYSLPGFVAAWGSAFDAARRHDLTICGPNVTDFEPLYTVGLLHLMRRSGRVPDVCTDNLFVERVIEPEVYDPHVGGRLLTGVLKLNLVKKARQLRHAAERYGVGALWNSYVSWTHPRIARKLPNVEAKQADYLTRYLVLTAASGAMERVYWGPLISSREGLIDDPGNPDGTEELVTFYGTVHGPADSYRPRAAFAALAQFNAVIPGSRYAGRLVSGDGLEVHAFESDTHLTHVVWTRNGAAAFLTDIYAATDLAAAQILAQDGACPPEPRLATEAPLYLRWPASRPVEVNESARPVPALAVNLHEPGGTYFPYRDADWQGLVIARDAAHAEQLIDALHPARVAELPRGGLLRKARNAIWTVQDPVDAHRQLAIKQPIKLRINKRLIERFRPSKARRSFSGACQLLRRGIDSPRPVAYFERAQGAGLTENWYICEYQTGSRSVRDYFTAYAAGEERYDGLTLNEFLDALVPWLVTLHRVGVVFRDLSGGNVLVRRTDDGTLAFSLIDTARARFTDGRVSMPKRLSDLKRLCHKLHWEGRRELMERYLAAVGRTFSPLYRVPFYLYDLKAGLKRRARGRF
ncbi:MAG: lipopolysaccharide kinase InaA family protein [Gammaproteobacteria bacterium]|nr:lipopolysaccharide kinase InaA family protein [Gammaproteobacteria bacterium]